MAKPVCSSAAQIHVAQRHPPLVGVDSLELNLFNVQVNNKRRQGMTTYVNPDSRDLECCDGLLCVPRDEPVELVAVLVPGDGEHAQLLHLLTSQLLVFG